MGNPVRVTKKILKDIDWRAFDELRHRINAGKHVVRVGVPSNTAEADGTPMTLVAAVHEFGSPSQGIPERPFLKTAIQENAKKYLALNQGNLVAVLRGQMSLEQALGQLGEMAKGHVQKKIGYGQFAPLDPKTIAARQRARSAEFNAKLRRKAASEPTTEKGKKHRIRTGGAIDRPLIDSGQLIQSITWAIE